MVCAGSSNLRWQEVADGALREAVKSRLRTNAYSGFAVEWVVACKGGVDEQDSLEEGWVIDRKRVLGY
ncbi:biotin synthase [Sesbania bispinosa]|nr:biotin synthase [Sesbania bispinosa]